MILLIPCIYVCIDNPYKLYCHFRLCSQEIIRILSFILGGRRLKFFSYKFIWIKQKKKTKQRQTRTRQTPPPCSNHNKERSSSYKKICFFLCPCVFCFVYEKQQRRHQICFVAFFTSWFGAFAAVKNPGWYYSHMRKLSLKKKQKKRIDAKSNALRDSLMKIITWLLLLLVVVLLLRVKTTTSFPHQLRWTVPECQQNSLGFSFHLATYPPRANGIKIIELLTGNVLFVPRTVNG